MEEVLINDSFSNLTYTKLKRFNKDYWKFVLIMFPTIPISAILPYLGNIYLKNNKDNIFVHGTIFPDNWTIIAGLIFALLFFYLIVLSPLLSFKNDVQTEIDIVNSVLINNQGELHSFIHLIRCDHFETEYYEHLITFISREYTCVTKQDLSHEQQTRYDEVQPHLSLDEAHRYVRELYLTLEKCYNNINLPE